MGDSTPQQQRRAQMCPSTSKLLLPSYASPTISSTAKMLSAEQTEAQSTPTKSSKSPRPRRDFKTYRLSTESSRSRSRRPGPFRFLDLPPDIRNMIYEYLAPSAGRRHTGSYASYKSATATSGPSYHPYSRLFTQPLPSLLLVKSKQIREEFGSYIFMQRHIHFTSLTRDGLADLFRLIGFLNCKRLVDNSEATLDVFDIATMYIPRRGRLELWRDVTWEDLSCFMDVGTLWKR